MSRSKATKHEWKYDGGGGGHNGEYTFTCKLCGASDWVSYASMREGDKPNAAGCRGKVTPQRPHKAAETNPEAIARLRKMVDDAFDGSSVSEQMLSNGPVAELVDDLRALLDAHAALKAAHTEALDALEKLQAAQKHVLEVMCAGEDAYMAAFDGADAILAKAGRR